MEEMGRSYLDELINRNMVQIKDMSKDDQQVKYCHVHDLIRGLSITKAKEEISFEILRQEGNAKFLDKPRHCAISCGTKKFICPANQNKHLRFLFFHGANGSIDSSLSYWKSVELLKILDFEDFRLRNVPDAIGALTGLKYLGLRNTSIQKLPHSLGRLKSLEVLDVANNMVTRIADVVWKMDSLRHLYMPKVDMFTGKELFLKINALKNLRTLTILKIDERMLLQLTKMISLRRLGLRWEDTDFSDNLCTSLSMLANLDRLKLGCYCFGNIDGLGIMHCITRLKLTGRLTKLPSATSFPGNLSSLTLRGTFLDEDPMPTLEELPKLSYLKLDGAYSGKEVVISHEGFSTLKILSLHWLWNLENIIVGNGGLQKLAGMHISICPNLDIPQQLRSITNI